MPSVYEESKSGIHTGFVYIFDVEADVSCSAEPQSLVKVGASGENAPADALEKEYWLHVLATLARYKKLLAPLNTGLDLPHGTSHSISVVRRAYETWLGRPIRQEDAENFGMRLKGRPPHSFEKILDAESTANAMATGEFSSLTALVRSRDDTRFLENQLRTLLGSPLPSSVMRRLTHRTFSGDSEFILMPTKLVTALRSLMVNRRGHLEAKEALDFVCSARNGYRLEVTHLSVSGLALDWPILCSH